MRDGMKVGMGAANRGEKVQGLILQQLISGSEAYPSVVVTLKWGNTAGG